MSPCLEMKLLDGSMLGDGVPWLFPCLRDGDTSRTCRKHPSIPDTVANRGLLSGPPLEKNSKVLPSQHSRNAPGSERAVTSNVPLYPVRFWSLDAQLPFHYEKASPGIQGNCEICRHHGDLARCQRQLSDIAHLMASEPRTRRQGENDGFGY